MPVANTPWRQVPLNCRLSLRYVKMFGRRAMSNELTLYFLALQSEAPAENLIRLLIHLKNAGVTQNEALQLFERFRDAVGCNRKDALEAED